MVTIDDWEHVKENISHPWNAHFLPIGRRFVRSRSSLVKPGHHVLLCVERGPKKSIHCVNVRRYRHSLRDVVCIIHSAKNPDAKGWKTTDNYCLIIGELTCGCRGQNLRSAWPTPWPGDTWCGRCGPHTGKPWCRARRCSRSSSPRCAPSCRSPTRRDPGESWPAIPRQVSPPFEKNVFRDLFRDNSTRESRPDDNQVVFFFQPVQTPGIKPQCV